MAQYNSTDDIFLESLVENQTDDFFLESEFGDYIDYLDEREDNEE